MRFETLVDFFVAQIPAVRKSQLKTLAALVLAFLKAANVSIAAIGRAIESMTKPKHSIKRVDRFLGNPRLHLSAFAEGLVRMICAQLANERLLLALDWTELHDGCHQTLVLALIAGGRAVPVLWRTVPKHTDETTRTQVELSMLEEFAKLKPSSCQAIIVADRGFEKIELFKKARRLGLNFIVRLKQKAYVFCHHYNGSLADLPVAGLRDWGRVLYTACHQYPIRLVTLYEAGQREPWLLATNAHDDARLVALYYARRMEIEECFRDLKNERNGLCLRGVNLHSPERYDRLFLVIAFAYFFMVLAGQWGEEQGLQRGLMANTERRRTLGLWRVGRWILNNGHRFPLRPEILVAKVRSVIQTATQIKLQFKAALASSS